MLRGNPNFLILLGDALERSFCGAQGSCCREILDHVIPLNEEHLRRLVRNYIDYHHEDRIHDALAKDTPNRRPIQQKPAANTTVISSARLGGLHHHYSWSRAA